MRAPGPIRLGLTALLLATAPAATASAQDTSGRLVVTVVDQTGGVLPKATVTVRGQDEATRAGTIAPRLTSEVGVAVFDALVHGRYTIQAAFPGFETVAVENVRLRGGETRQRVTLPLQKRDENVTVERDRRSAGLDPRGDAFSTILTRQQIDALPDDPEEMEAVLLAMAPPGSTIRVDGFTGGALPHKSQIRSIRLPRLDSFAPQNHGGMQGAMHIDIMTQPGMGPLRASTDFTLRDDALSARNPFVPEKGDEGLQRYGFSASGTIVPQRSSFSLNATVTRQYDTDNLLAALADGSSLAESVRRPVNGSNLSLRFDQALTDAHALRMSFQRSAFDRRNLGIGGFSLPEHGYSTESSQNVVRVSESGALGQRLFSETRFQFAWQNQESVSALEAPTVRVLDAFTSGGAQQRGGRHVKTFELASDLDYVRGNHSTRTGILLEGGWYRSDQFSNYLGTYTFASLEDFLAGRPRTYTRRIGDADVRYGNVQVGLYWQDDWRLSRSALLSYGVRYEAQAHMGQKANLSPRVSLSWSPFHAGHTTFRASAGYFYDWLDMSTYEQALRVDGFRQQELQVLDPAFPDPGLDGVVPPTNRYLLGPDRRMIGIRAFTGGVDRMFGQRGRASVGYSWREASNLLTGHNLNAPVEGARPDPLFANVIEARSTGMSRMHTINVGGSLMLLDWRRTFFATNYSWNRSESNSAGAFALPPSGDLSTEWGPSGPRHRFSAMLNMQPVSNVSFNLNVNGQSGLPYNVTTGADDNGDGVFNERPEGAGRNSARGTAHWAVGGRLTYSIEFGSRTQSSGGGPTVVTMGAGQGGFGGGGGSGYRVDLYVAAQNLLNRENYVGYSGVMTSPFFGQPTNVTTPRKLEVGVRFGF